MKTFFTVAGKLLLLAFIVAVIMFGLIIWIEILTGNIQNPGYTEDSVAGQMEYYAQVAAFTVGASFMYYAFDRKKGWSLGWKQPSPGGQYAKGMLLGFVAITLTCLGIAAVGAAHVQGAVFNEEVMKDMLKWLIMFVFVALNEELFCRGYLQGLVRHHYGMAAGIAVSSVLFALIHGMNPGVWSGPLPIVNLALAGVFLGLCREVSGGLWLPMGVHLTWNFFQGSVFGFPVSGEMVHPLITLNMDGPDWLSGGRFGAEGSLAATLTLLICSLWVYRQRRLLKVTAELRNFSI